MATIDQASDDQSWIETDISRIEIEIKEVDLEGICNLHSTTLKVVNYAQKVF